MASMLTTEDNPYDPTSQWAEWYAWDVDKGYNTCAYLARVVSLPDDFPEEVIERLIDNAIDEIIQIHSDGLYKKIELPSAA